MCGMGITQGHIKGIVKGYRTDLGAFAATVADVDIDKPGFAADRRCEVTRITIERDDFAVGTQLNIEVPAHFNQARRNGAH